MSINRLMPFEENEFITEGTSFAPELLGILEEFKEARPWRGTVNERKDKFRRLHAKLCDHVGKPMNLLLSVEEPEQEQSNGGYDPDSNTVGVVWKLSVVTYLFAFHLGAYGCESEGDKIEARRWAINLYARVFPRSSARMKTDGVVIVKGGE